MAANVKILVDASEEKTVEESMDFTMPMTDETRRDFYNFMQGIRYHASLCVPTQPPDQPQAAGSGA